MDGSLLSQGTVKICSLQEIAHAEYVVAAGADLFGLNFADSRRQISPETARAIVDESRTLMGEQLVRSVGVFVDQPADQINRIADSVGLDFVQLHGSEPPEFAELIERPVIRVFRTRPGWSALDVDRHLAGTMPGKFAAALVEGFHPSQSGGSGAVADWSLATEVAARYPVMLAGGLTPESVALAIRTVRPLGVDVSSGVDVDGRRNRERIISFVREARIAFAGLTAQTSKSSRSKPVSKSS